MDDQPGVRPVTETSALPGPLLDSADPSYSTSEARPRGPPNDRFLRIAIPSGIDVELAVGSALHVEEEARCKSAGDLISSWWPSRDGGEVPPDGSLRTWSPRPIVDAGRPRNDLGGAVLVGACPPASRLRARPSKIANVNTTTAAASTVSPHTTSRAPPRSATSPAG